MEKEDNEEYTAYYRIVANEEVFGHIYYGYCRPFKDKLYISINNEMLYNGKSIYIFAIDEALNLQYLYINALEIAFDINVSRNSVLSKFKKLLRNTEYTPIILNTAYSEQKQEIKGLHIYATGTRENLTKFQNTYIENVDKTMKLVIYDKSKEIEDNSNDKSYIIENLGFSKITRFEVRIEHKIIKDIIKQISSNTDATNEEMIANIANPNYYIKMYNIAVNRLIHFTKYRKQYSLFDLLFN